MDLRASGEEANEGGLARPERWCCGCQNGREQGGDDEGVNELHDGFALPQPCQCDYGVCLCGCG